MIRRIGLTGGIATGKSYVAGKIKEAGVPIVDADVLARDPYEAHAAAIAVARQRLLDEHNLMSLLARVVNGLGPAPPASAPALLRPARDFKGLANVARAIERLLGGQR